jgi:hypothetical protein
MADDGRGGAGRLRRWRRPHALYAGDRGRHPGHQARFDRSALTVAAN